MRKGLIGYITLLIIFLLIIITLIFFQNMKREKYEIRKRIMILCGYREDEQKRIVQLQLLNELFGENLSRDQVEFMSLNVLPEKEVKEREEEENPYLRKEVNLMNEFKSEFSGKTADLYVDNVGNLYDSKFEVIDDGRYIHYFDFIILESCPFYIFYPANNENLSEYIYRLKNTLNFTKLKPGGYFIIIGEYLMRGDPSLSVVDRFMGGSKSKMEYNQRFKDIFTSYLGDETTQVIDGILIQKN